jgi:protein-disulfide isomerase
MLMLIGPLDAKKEDKKAAPKPLPEICMGDAKAPILIIDYSSLACNHCADFHLHILSKLKSKYITPGYVRLMFRDFPGDQVSLQAHQIAWSKGEMKYLDFVQLLYEHQDKWLSAKDPIAALKTFVVQHGISAEQFDKALKDQELLDKIINTRLEGQQKYKITATPTLVINTKIYPNALTLQEIDDILEPLLKPIKEKEKTEKKSKKKGK